MKRFPLVVLFGLFVAISLSAVQKQLHEGVVRGNQPQKSQPRVDEIVLEGWQGTGMGTDAGELVGPGFKITLRRDGTALFTGKAKVKLIGDFKGTISSAEFEKLLSLLVARKYDRIPEDPVNRDQVTLAGATPRFDNSRRASGLLWHRGSPYMITSVVYEGGKTKNIFRPTQAWGIDLKHIPKELFEIEQAIFDAATRLDWEKVK